MGIFNKETMQDVLEKLLEKIEELKILNPDNVFISLLERAANVGSVSILNYDELQNDKIGSINIISICNAIISKSLEISDLNAKPLERVISTVENDFRTKGFMLDSDNQKVM